MSFETVQRDLMPNSAASSVSDEDLNEEERENIGELPVRSPAAKKLSKRLVRQGSISENFYAVKGAALILPRQTSLAVQNVQILKKYGGELQIHLRAIFHHLRPQDNIKLAVRLESWVESHRRYLVVISTTGRQDTEESIIVGCDFESKESKTCTIGMVLPVWCDTDIRLDGDGGFHAECRDRIHTFKPVSVQAMWSALQSLNRCVDVARRNNYFEGSLFLTWTCFYSSKINSDRIHINEWNYREDLSYASKQYFEKADPTRVPVEDMIRNKLKQVMMNMDLDNCTSRDIRNGLEAVTDMDLTDYKEYIDEEMLTVLGQMDCASEILDYLYLGSEWNACNLEELENLGITHILNVTIEIDNFFPENFRYKAIRLYDLEESDLLPHWNHTWKFIAEAKKCGGKCLVHCKMGISRSAATVCAYLMKEKSWSKKATIDYVRSRRSIICPNPAFQKQLEEYEGIISASSHRHNKLFRSRSESSLVESAASSDARHQTARSLSSKPLPIIQVADVSGGHIDVSVLSDDFDFNRHLLDIAGSSSSKMTRPKSWSPEEGMSPYVPISASKRRATTAHLDEEENSNHSLHVHNLSEPVELLVPSGVDPVRSGRVEELRRSFTHKRANLRRQTASGAVPLDDFDDFAQSEDSVFVNEGSSSFCNRPPKDKSKKRGDPPRSSSPAALCSEDPPGKDDLEPIVSTQETQLDKTGDLSTTEHDDVIADDVRKDEVCPANQPAEVFVKGHHKTLSLPPPVSEVELPKGDQIYAKDDDERRGRCQSASEAPTSVKQIVTAIESLQSPEVEGRSSNEGMKRSASMPSRKKNGAPAGNLFSTPERIVETEADVISQDPIEESSFYIGNTDDGKTSIRNVSPDLNANNNNNNNCQYAAPDDVTTASSPPKPEDESIEERHRLSPEVLHVIREVGVHLMMVDDADVSTATAQTSSSVSAKKRAVVRQMVREIEKGVRKLTGKLEKKAKVPKLKAALSVKARNSSKPNNGAGEIQNASLSECSSTFKLDSKTNAVPDYPRLDRLTSVKDITALVTPAPYRTPDTKRTSGQARFKLKVSAPRVRRTQSERAFVKPHIFKKPGYFRSFRTTDSNLLEKRLPIAANEIKNNNSATELDPCPSNRDRSASASKSCFSPSPSVIFRRVASSPQLSVVTSPQTFSTSLATNTADQVLS